MTEQLNNNTTKTSTYDIHQFITILKMCKINEIKYVKPNNILTSWEKFSEIFRVIKVLTNTAYIQDFFFYDSLSFFSVQNNNCLYTASLLYSDVYLFLANETPVLWPPYAKS